MSKSAQPDPRSLVKTQAETVPPPGRSVPEPPEVRAGAPPEVTSRLKELAREVGGMDRLRKIMDQMGGA